MRKNLAAELGKPRTDWKRIARLSAAAIERMAERDADNPATKKQNLAKSFIGAPPLQARRSTRSSMWTWWTGSRPRAASTRAK